MSVVTSQMELEKITSIGEKLGLTGAELRNFIRDERILLQRERDEARKTRAEEREHEKEKMEQAAKLEKEQRDHEKEQRAHEIEKMEQARRDEVERAKLEEDRIKLQHQLKYEEAMRLESVETKAMEREERSLELQIQVEDAKLKQIEMQAQNPPAVNAAPKGGQPSYKLPKLPKFDEEKDDMDAYIVRFERYAAVQGWDQKYWAINLGTLLTGKGLLVYYNLSAEEVNNYNVLKKMLLRRYELTEEGFRNKFRTSKPEPSETAGQYVTRIKKYLQRWFDLSGIDQTLNGLAYLLIKDQFINSCPKELSLYVKEHKPDSIESLSEIADTYIDAHQSWWPYPKRKGREENQMRQNTTQSNSRPVNNRSNTPHPTQQKFTIYQGQLTRNQGNRYPSSQSVRSNITCFLCARQGHRARDCPSKNSLAALIQNVEINYDQMNEETANNRTMYETAHDNRPHSLRSQVDEPTNYNQCGALQSRDQPGPVTFSNNKHQQPLDRSSLNPQSRVFKSTSPGNGASATRSYNPHILGYIETEHDPHMTCACEKGYLTLDCGHHLKVMTAACQHDNGRKKYLRMGTIGVQKVLAMRDSGCDGVVVKKAYVKPEQFTGGHRDCILIDGTAKRYPVAEVFIDTPFYTGKVLASCMEEPVLDLVVGNIPGVKDPSALRGTLSIDEQTEIAEATNHRKRYSSQKMERSVPVVKISSETTVETKGQRQADSKLMTPLNVVTSGDETIIKDALPKKQEDDPFSCRISGLLETGKPKQSREGTQSCSSVPSEMSSDLGSKFVFKVMGKVSRLLPIQRLTASFHDMGNSLVEGCKGTLKQIFEGTCQGRQEVETKEQTFLPAGPYKVKEEINTMHYQVDLGHCLTYRANHLKCNEIAEPAAICTQILKTEDTTAAVLQHNGHDMETGDQPLHNAEGMQLPPTDRSRGYGHVKSDINKRQKNHVKHKLKKFKSALTDLPRRTHLEKHAVTVTDGIHIRSLLYPIHHALIKIVRQDIENVFEGG